ncbi:MAG: hypothetical protein ACFE8F_02515 [Promethearchaeota archaeon]
MSPPTMSKEKRKINLDRLFAGATTATFIIQLLAILVLIGSSVGYLFVWSGIWEFIKISPYGQDILVFLLLCGGAIAFAILMLFFGFFIRSHQRVKRFVLGEEIGRGIRGSRDGGFILSLFAVAIVFFTLAGLYAIYLLWKYLVFDLWILTDSIYPSLIILSIAILVITFLIQLASRMVSRYATRTVKRITKEST